MKRGVETLHEIFMDGLLLSGLILKQFFLWASGLSCYIIN